MRSPILAFVVLIAALLGKIQAASAQSPASYPWCARFFGGELVGATSCYFTSKEQCMTTLSGIGGYCYQSPYYHRSAPPNAPRGRRRTGWRLREGRGYLDGRDAGGPDDRAGLCRLPHPNLGSSTGDDDTGLHRRRPRSRCDKRARHQPSRAQHHSAASHDCIADLHPKRRHHGPVRQWPSDQCGGNRPVWADAHYYWSCPRLVRRVGPKGCASCRAMVSIGHSQPKAFRRFSSEWRDENRWYSKRPRAWWIFPYRGTAGDFGHRHPPMPLWQGGGLAPR
jgi:hypothetical protein